MIANRTKERLDLIVNHFIPSQENQRSSDFLEPNPTNAIIPIALDTISALHGIYESTRTIQFEELGFRLLNNYDLQSLQERIQYYRKNPPTSKAELTEYENVLLNFRSNFYAVMIYEHKEYEFLERELSDVQTKLNRIALVEHKSGAYRESLSPWIRRAVGVLSEYGALTLAEQQLKLEFLEFVIGNQSLAKQLTDLSDRLPDSWDHDPIPRSYFYNNQECYRNDFVPSLRWEMEKMAQLAFSTLNLEELDSSTKHLHRLVCLGSNERALTHNEFYKITQLKELLGSFFPQLSNIPEDSHNKFPKLIKFLELKSLLEKIESTSNDPVFQRTYQSGDIVLLKVDDMDFLERISGQHHYHTELIIKVNSFLYTPTPFIFTSEISDTHEVESKSTSSIFEYFGNNIRRISPIKLLNPSYKQPLIQALQVQDETELSKALDDLYQKSVVEIHELIDMNNIKNRSGRYGHYSVLADYIPRGHLDHKSPTLHRWAMHILTTGEANVTSSFVSKSTPRSMMCSEFVAKVTVLSIAKLNQHLVHQLQLHPDTGIIKMPFDPHERLHLIYPTRLFNLIEKYSIEVEAPMMKKIVKN